MWLEMLVTFRLQNAQHAGLVGRIFVLEKYLALVRFEWMLSIMSFHLSFH